MTDPRKPAASGPALRPEHIQALREYADQLGGLHEPDCSLDDTCDCKWFTVNRLVNELCSMAPSALAAPPHDENMAPHNKFSSFWCDACPRPAAPGGLAATCKCVIERHATVDCPVHKDKATGEMNLGELLRELAKIVNPPLPGKIEAALRARDERVRREALAASRVEPGAGGEAK